MMTAGRLLGPVFAVLLTSSPTCADDSKDPIDRLRQRGYSVRTVTPIYSQLLVTGYPPGFVPAFEKAKEKFYIRESVPTGESVGNWTEMISITGMKDLASKPEATAKSVLDGMAGGFKRACPNSFTTQFIGESKISGYDAAIAVVSCGLSPTTAGKTSESALLVVIKGQADYYTIQWAERTSPSNAPIAIDVAKWSDRLKKLGPLALCPRIPGEKAPYPSCVGGEKKPA